MRDFNRIMPPLVNSLLLPFLFFIYFFYKNKHFHFSINKILNFLVLSTLYHTNHILLLLKKKKTSPIMFIKQGLIYIQVDLKLIVKQILVVRLSVWTSEHIRILFIFIV
jgi:hypothetical protein